MPVNSLSSFNPTDEDSWFFGSVSRSSANEILLRNNETGAFMVRESTSARGELVLSVRERDDKVSHYIINRICPSTDEIHSQLRFKIGEQIFQDIPTLLAFYMINNLDDTPLKVPAKAKDLPLHKRSFTKDYLAEIVENNRSSLDTKVNLSSTHRQLPGLAQVIQTKIPNAYDKTALTLRKGDIVKVIKMDVSGCWEGEVGGRKGHFPFNYVKFIEDNSAEIKN